MGSRCPTVYCHHIIGDFPGQVQQRQQSTNGCKNHSLFRGVFFMLPAESKRPGFYLFKKQTLPGNWQVCYWRTAGVTATWIQNLQNHQIRRLTLAVGRGQANGVRAPMTGPGKTEWVVCCLYCIWLAFHSSPELRFAGDPCELPKGTTDEKQALTAHFGTSREGAALLWSLKASHHLGTCRGNLPSWPKAADFAGPYPHWTSSVLKHPRACNT